MAKTNPIPQEQSEEQPDRITILVSAPNEAAMEIHRQNMWAKGYRLERAIEAGQYFQSNGREIQPLFDGAPMYAATFVK